MIVPGPILMTVGPWQPITLETYTARITDLDIRAIVSEDLSAKLDVTFSLSEHAGKTAKVALKNLEGALLIGQSNIKITSTETQVHFGLSPETFDLWYPVGYGKQPLYTVEVQVTDSVNGSSAHSLLSIHLIQMP